MRTIAASLAALLAAACSGELVPSDPIAPTGPDAAPPEETTAFRPGIQSDIDSLGCIVAGCHATADVVPMMLYATPATDAEWEQNYTQVMARAATSPASLLIEKATGAGGHTAPLDASDPIVARWRAWIELGMPYQAATGGGPDAGSAGADGAPDPGGALTWDGDIGPLMAADGCTECHGNDGAYSVESYSAALGFGTDDTPNVIPGDALSLLAVYCEQGHYDMPYADTLLVLSWIVDYGAIER